MKNLTNESIQNFLFHYNPYKNKWCCFAREDSNYYFNSASTKEKLVTEGDTVEEAFDRYWCFLHWGHPA